MIKKPLNKLKGLVRLQKVRSPPLDLTLKVDNVKNLLSLRCYEFIASYVHIFVLYRELQIRCALLISLGGITSAQWEKLRLHLISVRIERGIDKIEKNLRRAVYVLNKWSVKSGVKVEYKQHSKMYVSWWKSAWYTVDMQLDYDWYDEEDGDCEKVTFNPRGVGNVPNTTNSPYLNNNPNLNKMIGKRDKWTSDLTNLRYLQQAHSKNDNRTIIDKDGTLYVDPTGIARGSDCNSNSSHSERMRRRSSRSPSPIVSPRSKEHTLVHTKSQARGSIKARESVSVDQNSSNPNNQHDANGVMNELNSCSRPFFFGKHIQKDGIENDTAFQKWLMKMRQDHDILIAILKDISIFVSNLTFHRPRHNSIFTSPSFFNHLTLPLSSSGRKISNSSLTSKKKKKPHHKHPSTISTTNRGKHLVNMQPRLQKKAVVSTQSYSKQMDHRTFNPSKILGNNNNGLRLSLNPRNISTCAASSKTIIPSPPAPSSLQKYPNPNPNPCLDGKDNSICKILKTSTANYSSSSINDKNRKSISNVQQAQLGRNLRGRSSSSSSSNNDGHSSLRIVPANSNPVVRYGSKITVSSVSNDQDPLLNDINNNSSSGGSNNVNIDKQTSSPTPPNVDGMDVDIYGSSYSSSGYSSSGSDTDDISDIGTCYDSSDEDLEDAQQDGSLNQSVVDVDGGESSMIVQMGKRLGMIQTQNKIRHSYQSTAGSNEQCSPQKLNTMNRNDNSSALEAGGSSRRDWGGASKHNRSRRRSNSGTRDDFFENSNSLLDHLGTQSGSSTPPHYKTHHHRHGKYHRHGKHHHHQRHKQKDHQYVHVTVHAGGKYFSENYDNGKMSAMDDIVNQLTNQLLKNEREEKKIKDQKKNTNPE